MAKNAADIVRDEISDHAAHIAQLERELAERRAAKTALERLLRKFDEPPIPRQITITPAPVELHVQVGKPSVAVERRASAMASVLREKGPMGPGALREAVEAALANGPVTRGQIVDVLRRRPQTFRKLKRGRYGLKETP